VLALFERKALGLECFGQSSALSAANRYARTSIPRRG
jgi:hypothetical protein